MGSPIFPGIEHIIECGKSRRVHAVVGTPTCVESNRPLTASNQFHAISARRPRQTDRENALQRSGVASRTLSRRCITKTMEPGTCAQTRDTGYRPFVRNPDEAPVPPNGLAVI